jgi:hypothetical protein
VTRVTTCRKEGLATRKDETTQMSLVKTALFAARPQAVHFSRIQRRCVSSDSHNHGADAAYPKEGAFYFVYSFSDIFILAS